MARLRALFEHPTAGPTIRYGIAGGAVGGVYLSIPLILDGVFSVPIEVAIPIAYVLAVSLHFTLQRTFVWRHVDQFALSTREQVARYLVIGAIQYPMTALSTAVLPGLLSVSERVVFVGTTLVVSITFFLVLRTHVFHPAAESEHP
jgi:putative flippase GtrA